MRLTFIQGNTDEKIPAFVVNYEPKSWDIVEKTEEIAISILFLLPNFLGKCQEAFYETKKNFHVIVSTLDRPTNTIHPYHLTVAAINFLFCCASFFLSYLIDVYSQEFQKDSIETLLKLGNINPEHLKSIEQKNSLESPEGMELDVLYKVLGTINFSKPCFGYIGEAMRRDDYSPLSEQDISQRIITLIHNFTTNQKINKSPPIDSERRAWYDGLKKDILTAVHLANEQLRTFADKEGAEGLRGIDLIRDLQKDTTQAQIRGLSRELKAELLQIIEQRARIVINLAIASDKCATRYSQETHQIIQGYTQTVSVEDMPLSDHLHHLLANLRTEILNRKAAAYQQKMHAERDVLGLEAHYTNIYMIAIGRLFHVPHTDKIIEKMLTEKMLGFDRRQHILDFLSAYDFSAIIEAIKKEYNKSEILRDKISDWVKTQVGDWNLKFYEDKKNELAEKLKEIRDSAEDPSKKQRAINALIQKTLFLPLAESQRAALLENDDLLDDLVEQARLSEFQSQVLTPLTDDDQKEDFLFKLIQWVLIENQIISV